MTPPSTPLEPGFYWIRPVNSTWTIGEYVAEPVHCRWFILGFVDYYSWSRIAELGERVLRREEVVIEIPAAGRKPAVEQVIINGFARRIRVDHFTPAEKAIYDAVGVVEEAGAHEWLTDAVLLLQAAREKVADYVDMNLQKEKAASAQEKEAHKAG